MRGKTTLFALGIAVFGASAARSQEAAENAAKGAKRDAAQPKAQPAVVDAKTAREQTVFKDWARAIRESVETSKKFMGKKQAERTAWAMRSAKAKEDKIRVRYRLSSYRLFLILKR